MAAEAEAVGQDVLHADFAGRVRDVIQVATGGDILVLEVDRRVQHAVLDGERTGDRLDPAARPAQGSCEGPTRG